MVAEELSTVVDDEVRALASRPGASAVGAVRLRGDGVERHVAGTDLPDGLEASSALFEAGSLTKVVTTVLLAAAVGRGEVSLTTRLWEVLVRPGGGRDAGASLEQLASHTAGAPPTPLPPLQTLRKTGRWLLHREDPWAGVDSHGLQRALAERSGPAGGRPLYSNVGVAVLAQALVEAAGAADYEQLVRDRVVGPLGLTSTTTRPDDEQQRRRVGGRSRRGRAVPSWDLTAAVGAGGLLTTADDLLTFSLAWLRPDEGPLAEAVQLVLEHRVGERQVPMGWQPPPRPGRDLRWHNGGTGGCSAWWSVGDGAAVVVLHGTSRLVDPVGLRLHRRLVPEHAV